MFRKDLKYDKLSFISLVLSIVSLVIGGGMAIRPLQVYISYRIDGYTFDPYYGIAYLFLGLALVIQFVSVIARYTESDIYQTIMYGLLVLSNLFLVLKYTMTLSIVYIVISCAKLGISIYLTYLLYTKPYKYKSIMLFNKIIAVIYIIEIIINRNSFFSGYTTMEMVSQSTLITKFISTILVIIIVLVSEFYYLWRIKREDDK